MVWGMSLPSGFGEFFLDGDFEGDGIRPDAIGWSGRLKKYFNEQLAEDEKALFDDGHGPDAVRYVSYVASKFRSEIGTKGDPCDPPLSAIAACEPPRSFDLEKRVKSIGSLVMLTDRILAVDEALKEIIERLDLGVHQFFPIKIRRRNGEEYPRAYYIIVVGQYFDSFSLEKSDQASFEKDGERGFFHKETKVDMGGLAFRKAVFGHAHLWRDRRMSREWLTCFSDELVAEITKAGLRIPKHYRMMEV